MAYIVFKNGYRSEWDETIQVGDLITAYHSGFHRVDRIDLRNYPNDSNPMVETNTTGITHPPLIHYTKVLTDKGLKTKAVHNCCDASYCKKIDSRTAQEIYEREVAEVTRKYAVLSEFIGAVGAI